jgi:hypothetical protein
MGSCRSNGLWKKKKMMDEYGAKDDDERDTAITQL